MVFIPVSEVLTGKRGKTMKPHPHSIFQVWTPDTVAECMNGVFSAPNGLYAKLWSLVPAKRPYDIEDNGPADVVGIGSVAKNWESFSAEEAILLNDLAVKHESCYA